MEMKSSKHLVGIGLAMFAAIASPITVRAATLVVDDDLSQCPKATHTTMQAAVVDANPGDLIKVCAGAYEGPVVVPHSKPGLRFEGVRVDTAERTGDAAQEAVLRSAPGVICPASQCPWGRGFDIQAPNILVKGFTIERTLEQAIQIGATAVGSTVVTGAVILENKIIGAGFPCLVVRGRGINMVSADVTAPDTGHVVKKNMITGSCQAGIRINQASANTVRDNQVEGALTRPGIALRNADRNRLQDNEIVNNANTNPNEAGGISLDALSTDNTIKHNLLTGNTQSDGTVLDVEDDTVPVANRWRNNLCTSSDSSTALGLCEDEDED